MADRSCDICNGKDGKMAPAVPSLLDRHLGIFVYREVSSCNDCSQVLQMWDNFSKQAKGVLKTTHPHASFRDMQGSPINSRKRQKAIEHVVLDVDSDSSDVMICEDDADAIDVVYETPLHEHIPKKPSLKKTLNIPLSTQIIETIPVNVDKSPIRFERLPTIWDVPNVSNETKTSEPVSDPLALIPLIVKQESCTTITNAFVKENEKINDMNSQLLTEVIPFNEVIDPLLQEDIKPAIPICPVLDSKVPFYCNLCNKKFVLQHVLNLHMKSKHRKQSASVKNRDIVYHKCPHCQKYASSKEGLQRHILKYHSSNSESIKLDYIHLCEKCCKSFKSKEILKAHLENVHLKTNLLHENTECDNLIESDETRCPFCFKNYANLKNLERHISLSHPDPDNITMAFIVKRNNVICGFCNKNLCSKKMLKYHILNVHADIISGKTQKCMRTNSLKNCNYSFLSQDSLQKSDFKNHLLSNASTSNVNYSETKSSNHNIENGTICITTNNVNMSEKETVKLFKCKICNHICISRDILRNHKFEKHGIENTHSSLANAAKFMCTPCSKSFPCKETFEIHNKIHHSIQPIFSPTCGRRSLTQNNETLCRICNRVFPTKRGLSAHIKSHQAKNSVGETVKNNKLQNENFDKSNVDEQNTNDKEKLIQTSNKQNEKPLKYVLYEGKFKKRDGSYFCNFCLKPSDSLDKIIYHLNSCHLTKDDIKKLKCKTVEPLITSKHSCEICHESFECYNDLSVHSKTHAIQKNVNENVSESKRNLEPSSSLTTEDVLLDLIAMRNLSCHFCKQTLKSMDEIYNHCQKNHEHKLKKANKKFMINCNVCSVIISSMDTLGTHIENNHKNNHLTKETRNQNKYCKKDEIPEILHSNQSTSISLHVNNVASKPFLTTVISSTALPEVKKFYCFICNKLLHSKQAMEYHIKQSHIKYHS